MEEYTKEQLRDLYNQLPDTLKDAVYSNKIGETVKKICEGNNLQDSFMDILRKVGYVFLGILSPNEFKEELKSPSVFAEINNGVFLSFQQDLEQLYGIKMQKIEESKKEATSSSTKNQSEDKYLEPLE